MTIREIDDTDLPSVVALLAEGFPKRTPAYWRAGISRLTERPPVAGYPHYGYLLESDGDIQGVILSITASIDSGLRSNLSSWYVRPRYRQLATFLLRRAFKREGGVYLNMSPADHVRSIMDAFGFRAYTAGALLLDARAAVRSRGSVRPVDANTLSLLPEHERTVVSRHLAYGCMGIVLETSAGMRLALYRTGRFKRIAPYAQFVYGRPETIVSYAGPVMRALARKGVPLAMVDAEGPGTCGTFLAGRNVRYFRGARHPALGDLLESEIAIFGP